MTIFGTKNDIKFNEFRMNLGIISVFMIDEKSFLDKPLMKKIHDFCQNAKKSNKPFSGISIIMFGDNFQLASLGTPL